MQRYKKKEDAQVGHFIAFDNTTRFYQGIPTENLVGEIIELGEGDDLKVKLNLRDMELVIDLPYYLAQ